MQVSTDMYVVCVVNVSSIGVDQMQVLLLAFGHVTVDRYCCLPVDLAIVDLLTVQHDFDLL